MKKLRLLASVCCLLSVTHLSAMEIRGIEPIESPQALVRVELPRYFQEVVSARVENGGKWWGKLNQEQKDAAQGYYGLMCRDVPASMDPAESSQPVVNDTPEVQTVTQGYLMNLQKAVVYYMAFDKMHQFKMKESFAEMILKEMNQEQAAEFFVLLWESFPKAQKHKWYDDAQKLLTPSPFGEQVPALEKMRFIHGCCTGGDENVAQKRALWRVIHNRFLKGGTHMDWNQVTDVFTTPRSRSDVVKDLATEGSHVALNTGMDIVFLPWTLVMGDQKISYCGFTSC